MRRILIADEGALRPEEQKRLEEIMGFLVITKQRGRDVYLVDECPDPSAHAFQDEKA